MRLVVSYGWDGRDLYKPLGLEKRDRSKSDRLGDLRLPVGYGDILTPHLSPRCQMPPLRRETKGRRQ
ncbi:hypothetical protein TgHK011_003547 [Trichoderma gracile]|nr:hypothetical protein TgHK011_003547 [Trichoderma gracile]